MLADSHRSRIRLGAEGFEHPPKTSGKTHNSQTGGAESGALGARADLPDPTLAGIISAWPGLPEAVKARIVGLVEGATARS
jgi:hypothetical protein